MGSYVEIGELKTWYDEQGEGEPLVLLHGGMSMNETWGAQMPDFGARFRVTAPERRGHGHTPDLEGPMSYDVMANDTIGFLEAVVGNPAHLIGWSDGGIVGLLIAMARPDLVRKLVVIGAILTLGIVPQAMQGLTSMTAEATTAVFRTPYEAALRTVPALADRVRCLNTTEHHTRAARQISTRRRRRHDQPRAHVGAL
jgi:pimeloyl-ACP methyl ester carboxylesterase